MTAAPLPSTTTKIPNAEHYDGATYYGRPALKAAPFENSVVGGYIFLAGLSGSAQLISTLADFARVPGRGRALRTGRWLSLLAPTVGSALLVYDLHTPQRFYNMLRIAKRTSPMSIGTWILMGFSGFAGVTAGLQALGDFVWPRRRKVLDKAASVTQVPAAMAGAGLSTYTAALLSATSTPLWAAAPKSLAVRFGSSAMASGAAALALAERRNGGNRRLAHKLDSLALAALAVELGASLVSETTYRKSGISAAHDAAKTLRTMTQVGTLAPFALHFLGGKDKRNSSLFSDLASLAILAGGLCLRVGIMQAGDESASRPEDYFRFTQSEK